MAKTRHFLIASLFFSVSVLYINSSYAEKPKHHPVEWLFVITAKAGEIKQNQAGQYVLSLHHAHIERVLAFSDRPNRMVKFISPKAFKTLWGKGKNSFKKDPPNAIVVFGQQKIAVKLMNVSVNDNKTSFVVESINNAKLYDIKMRKVSIFIDPNFARMLLRERFDGAQVGRERKVKFLSPAEKKIQRKE